MQDDGAARHRLSNLRARLQAFFGADAALELHERRAAGVRAEIVFAPVDEAATKAPALAERAVTRRPR